MMKHKILKFFLFTVIVLAGCVFGAQEKAYAATWCAVLAYAPSGNCLDGQDYTALTNLSSSDSSDTLKSKLIAKMNGFDNGQHFQRVGSLYTKNRFTRNNPSQFAQRINQASVTLEVSVHSYTTNTAYEPSSDSVIVYNETDSNMSVKVRQNGVLVGAIKLDCGNIVGGVAGISLDDWTLTLDTDADISTAIAGQVTHFDHTVRNNGPDAADYNWWVRGSYNGSAYSVNTGYTPPLPSGSRTGTANGATGPTNLQENYIFPASAQNGDLYCQRIYASNADGPGTGERYSPRKCVRFITGAPLPSGGSDECFTLTIPRPPEFGNGNTARTRYWVDGSNATGGNIQSDSSSASVTINYLPDSPDGTKATVTVHMVTEYNNTSPAVWKAEFATTGNPAVAMAGYTAPVTRPHHCYAATCNLVVEGGSGPNGIVLAGQTLTIKGEIVNAANATYPEKTDLPENIPGGHRLGLTTGAGAHPIGSGVELNDSKPDPLITLGTFTAQGSAGTQTISGYAYPDYWGRNGVGPACPDISFNVYQQFTITPTAGTPTGNSEEPESTDISYTTSGSKASGNPDITATATSWLTNGLTTVKGTDVVSHTYGTNVADNFTYDVTSTVPGDKYCSHIIISPASGYLGPGGTILYPQDDRDDSGCLTIHNEPYVHFTGSDVFAGNSFLGACTPALTGNKAKISAYTKTTGTQPRGSGGQFAALAIDDIEGFSSANLRNILTPLGSYGASFGNTNTLGVANNGLPVSSNKLVTGGKYGVSNTCLMPDYSSQMPQGATTYINQNLGAMGTHAYKHTGGGAITIGPGQTSVVNEANNALYTDGDVIITGDIKYVNADSGSGWQNVSDIPSLLIVAKGNIIIGPGVKRLDGIFVAQGTGVTKGIIDTCSPKDFDDCKEQLVVNGAFLAREVYLNRNYSSLRFSEQNESQIFGSDHDCGPLGGKDTPPSHRIDKDCAAEIFNFSPEIFMSQPAINPSGTGKFQSYKSLSPVL